MHLLYIWINIEGNDISLSALVFLSKIYVITYTLVKFMKVKKKKKVQCGFRLNTETVNCINISPQSGLFVDTLAGSLLSKLCLLCQVPHSWWYKFFLQGHASSGIFLLSHQVKLNCFQSNQSLSPQLYSSSFCHVASFSNNQNARLVP